MKLNDRHFAFAYLQEKNRRTTDVEGDYRIGLVIKEVVSTRWLPRAMPRGHAGDLVPADMQGTEGSSVSGRHVVQS